ncbi:MAG TPA: cyclic nucleotide-binding domain-containing protein [Chitinophagaceae bacterium]|nr:cyclic nucleotide-binding domain-containing protein [Chitinophagaceae bacterium]
MKPAKTFLDFLNKFISLSLEEYNELIVPCVIKRHFEKKTIITETGEIENYINFIDNGLVRKYYKKGTEEINTQISYEGHIIHAQESFHSRTPSEYTIEAVEPSELTSITFECLEKIYSSSEKMQQLGRLVITATMVLKDKWQSQLIKLTPRERFIRFVTKHPELMQRVPQKYLASYLNIKPETFSRFKHMVKEYSKKILFHQN